MIDCGPSEECRYTLQKNKEASHEKGIYGIGECRQVLDCSSRFILDNPQFVELLQVHPEFRACPEEMPKPQRRVASQGPASVQNFRDAFRRHLECTTQFSRAHAQLFKRRDLQGFQSPDKKVYWFLVSHIIYCGLCTGEPLLLCALQKNAEKT
jgi:hypothetical protein